MVLNLVAIKKTDNSRYSNGDHIRLVNFGPTALFNNFKLTTNSEKHLEDICHALIVSLMYKIITSKKASDDLSIGFNRDCNGRRDEVTNTKNVKSKYHLRNMLEDVFGFAENQY